MPYIETIAEDEATGEAAALVEADRARVGYVPNYTRAFLQRPAVYQAWRALIGAIQAEMDPRRYELVTVAAAGALRSTYCALAHGTILADRFYPAHTVSELARDHHSTALEPLDAALMDLGAKVAEDATSVTAEEIAELRELGLADAEIFDVVVAAAARCFFSKTLDALCVQADASYRAVEPELRNALTVGRPIAGD
jgi:uncharacterized peroxidase-related enzyme